MITIDPIKKAAADKERESIKAKAYLVSTDWHVSRQAESGKPIPAEVLSKRAEARLKI